MAVFLVFTLLSAGYLLVGIFIGALLSAILHSFKASLGDLGEKLALVAAIIWPISLVAAPFIAIFVAIVLLRDIYKLVRKDAGSNR